MHSVFSETKNKTKPSAPSMFPLSDGDRHSPILNPLLLTAGAAALGPGRRGLHAGYLARSQRPDGGFAGRKGESDAYYTAFALRGLTLLAAFDGALAARLVPYVRSLAGRTLPLVDYLSAVSAGLTLEVFAGSDPFTAEGGDRQAMFRQAVAPYQRADGGFAKSARGASSTYATFLVGWTAVLLGLPRPCADTAVRFLADRRREGGGFAEAAGLRQGGTNPTAAAVGLMRLGGVGDWTGREATIAFLLSMQDAGGGFRASAAVPVADLLSTYTALVALADLGAAGRADLGAAERFIGQLESREGGFRAGVWDDTVDVEYTFYGTAALALLGGLS